MDAFCLHSAKYIALTPYTFLIVSVVRRPGWVRTARSLSFRAPNSRTRVVVTGPVSGNPTQRLASAVTVTLSPATWPNQVSCGHGTSVHGCAVK